MGINNLTIKYLRIKFTGLVWSIVVLASAIEWSCNHVETGFSNSFFCQIICLFFEAVSFVGTVSLFTVTLSIASSSCSEADAAKSFWMSLSQSENWMSDPFNTTEMTSSVVNCYFLWKTKKTASALTQQLVLVTMCFTKIITVIWITQKRYATEIRRYALEKWKYFFFILAYTRKKHKLFLYFLNVHCF